MERYFRTTNETVLHWLPGDTRKRDFGNPDNRLNATLDIKQLTKLIIYSILEHNKYHLIEKYPMDLDMIAGGVRPVPMELWHWGIENRVGRLRQECRESITCKLLPRTTAIVTANGVRSSTGIHYTFSQAADLQWFERARTSGTWQVDMAVNPHNLDEVYVISKAGAVTPCSILPRDYRFRDLCFEELEDFNAGQNIKKDLHKDVKQQGRSDTISLSEMVISEAHAQTELVRQLHPPPSKRSQLQNIHENRANEKESLRMETAIEDGIFPFIKKRMPATEDQKQEVVPTRQINTDILLNKIISFYDDPK